jgi:hypothetical protein
MRDTLALLASLMLVSFFACSKQESPPTTPDLAVADAVAGEGVAAPDQSSVDGTPVAKDGSGSKDLPTFAHYLSFNESLCAGVGSGSKKLTLRNKHITYLTVGEWIKLICSTSKTTYKGQVTEVRKTTWGGITADEYTADGFSSQANMLSIMQTYYPGISLSDPATVVRWDRTAPYP